MRDKYKQALRIKEARQREKQKLETERLRQINKALRNKPVDERTMRLWNSQPAIRFDLSSKKKY